MKVEMHGIDHGLHRRFTCATHISATFAHTLSSCTLQLLLKPLNSLDFSLYLVLVGNVNHRENHSGNNEYGILHEEGCGEPFPLYYAGYQ